MVMWDTGGFWLNLGETWGLIVESWGGSGEIGVSWGFSKIILGQQVSLGLHSVARGAKGHQIFQC